MEEVETAVETGIGAVIHHQFLIAINLMCFYDNRIIVPLSHHRPPMVILMSLLVEEEVVVEEEVDQEQ
jgi:hypothetical protein